MGKSMGKDHMMMVNAFIEIINNEDKRSITESEHLTIMDNFSLLPMTARPFMIGPPQGTLAFSDSKICQDLRLIPCICLSGFFS